ncbi:hypothetical protein VOLCADRAFT_101171 [Volvox carteri f. nagariensis]|uniref:Uncharacterized protein n=1 Tax=Volvox carteri f. nagariensis TaxID=3068 RepID=D8ULY1_VOLCA|nr:uncharacterized protein VOLCADRAFT_101171 [Volvox carteri f. nagariensis]EFJ39270.1 hypothetical protein VOLCADRAFT_101171 [Volvox carteri f. nagariensis]|eukprot:XP_002959667.1 hypothetical protein VOLCADRAFT_101171 [Volvox carteri f. nagariensis]
MNKTASQNAVQPTRTTLDKHCTVQCASNCVVSCTLNCALNCMFNCTSSCVVGCALKCASRRMSNCAVRCSQCFAICALNRGAVRCGAVNGPERKNKKKLMHRDRAGDRGSHSVSRLAHTTRSERRCSGAHCAGPGVVRAVRRGHRSGARRCSGAHCTGPGVEQCSPGRRGVRCTVQNEKK